MNLPAGSGRVELGGLWRKQGLGGRRWADICIQPPAFPWPLQGPLEAPRLAQRPPFLPPRSALVSPRSGAVLSGGTQQLRLEGLYPLHRTLRGLHPQIQV